MRENECILDANAVLRFLLQDNEEQFQQVKTVIQRKNCYVTSDKVMPGMWRLLSFRSMVFPITRISCQFLWQSDNVEKFMVVPPQFDGIIIPCM